MLLYSTYEDVHEHVQRQSVLLSSLAKPRTDFLAVLLNKPHDLLHVFSYISHLILLRTKTSKHNHSILNRFFRQ